jgi:hypothetical protein
MFHRIRCNIPNLTAKYNKNFDFLTFSVLHSYGFNLQFILKTLHIIKLKSAILLWPTVVSQV